MQQSGIRMNRRPCGERGFSLVEAIVAIAVLSIGVLSLARMIPFATRTDYGARTDSTATFIAMRQMEQILAQPWNLSAPCGGTAAPCFTDAQDDAGTSVVVNLACTCATIPCGPPSATPPGTAGGPLTAAGTINFTAAAVPGYQRFYTINNVAGTGSVKVNQGQYDVRWHITCSRYGPPGGTWNGAGIYNIVVAARPVGTVPGMIAIPAHVRSVKMK